LPAGAHDFVVKLQGTRLDGKPLPPGGVQVHARVRATVEAVPPRIHFASVTSTELAPRQIELRAVRGATFDVDQKDADEGLAVEQDSGERRGRYGVRLASFEGLPKRPAIRFHVRTERASEPVVISVPVIVSRSGGDGKEGP
jgi:hypothetical protein